MRWYGSSVHHITQAIFPVRQTFPAKGNLHALQVRQSHRETRYNLANLTAGRHGTAIANKMTRTTLAASSVRLFVDV